MSTVAPVSRVPETWKGPRIVPEWTGGIELVARTVKHTAVGQGREAKEKHRNLPSFPSLLRGRKEGRWVESDAISIPPSWRGFQQLTKVKMSVHSWVGRGLRTRCCEGGASLRVLDNLPERERDEGGCTS